ncbi:MAG: flagellar export chaperone FliS [Bacillota bacterium]|nr:flagellar export chaperone FliS [Thermoanaerobacteraceae bacterium]
MEDKSRLLLMLYDGAIGFLSRAIEALEAGGSDEVGQLIVRAQGIISELKGALDMKYEVAQSLCQLYDYFNRRLTEANAGKDSLPVCEVQGYLKELREAWSEAAVRVGGTTAPPSVAGMGG